MFGEYQQFWGEVKIAIKLERHSDNFIKKVTTSLSQLSLRFILWASLNWIKSGILPLTCVSAIGLSVFTFAEIKENVWLYFINNWKYLFAKIPLLFMTVIWDRSTAELWGTSKYAETSQMRSKRLKKLPQEKLGWGNTCDILELALW